MTDQSLIKIEKQNLINVKMMKRVTPIHSNDDQVCYEMEMTK